MYRLAIILTSIATFITWLLISLGAAVRLFGAGLACPDWPLCYGTLAPALTLPILLEVGHRYLASLLGLLIIFIYLLCIYSDNLRQQRRLAGWVLILVIVQGLMGGLTVLLKLNFSTVVAHLLLGNLLFFGLVCLLCAMLLYPKTTLKNRIAFTPSPRYFQLWIMVFLFFLMLLSGGLNSSNYAGYVCEAFPFCNANSSFSFFIKNKNIFFNAWQGISLQLNLLEVIHLFHRLVVILGSFYLIYIAIFYWMKDAKIWKILGYSLSALLLLELVVGIANALLKVPIPISLLHTTLASSITGVLAWAFSLAKYRTHSKAT